MNCSRTAIAFLSFAACLAIGGTIAAAATPAKTHSAGGLSPRFQQVRDRIDALFRYRLETPPPPDPRLNPFHPPGAVVTRTPGNPSIAAPEPLASDLTLLQQSVAALKVSGMFEIEGQQHLIINGKTYRKGDVVQVTVQGAPVFLRVREVMLHSVTFALNDTEVTLKF